MAPAEIYRVRGESASDVLGIIEREESPGELVGVVQPGVSMAVLAGAANFIIECDSDNRVRIKDENGSREIMSDQPPVKSSYAAVAVDPKLGNDWFVVRKTKLAP